MGLAVPTPEAAAMEAAGDAATEVSTAEVREAYTMIKAATHAMAEAVAKFVVPVMECRARAKAPGPRPSPREATPPPAATYAATVNEKVRKLRQAHPSSSSSAFASFRSDVWNPSVNEP